MTVFLDHNSTTPILELARLAMVPYFDGRFYNPSGIQQPCRNIMNDIDDARELFCNIIANGNGTMIFTASATEANNLAICQQFFDDVITTPIEHPSVTVAAENYHKGNVHYVDVLEDGTVSLEGLLNILNKLEKKRILVSIQHANQVVHTVQPVDRISKICKEYENVVFHSDATQTFGKLPIDALDADMVTISSHKCYGPKGAAGLWISDAVLKDGIRPLICGGHQEYNLRAGTYNVPAIIGFATAANYMNMNLQKHIDKILILSQQFQKHISNAFKDVQWSGNAEKCIPGGLHFAVPGIDSRTILMSMPDIIISTGMSCSSEEADPVMGALGKANMARHSFRVQIGFENTEAEINIACTRLIETINKARNFWGLM